MMMVYNSELKTTEIYTLSESHGTWPLSQPSWFLTGWLGRRKRDKERQRKGRCSQQKDKSQRPVGRVKRGSVWWHQGKGPGVGLDFPIRGWGVNSEGKRQRPRFTGRSGERWCSWGKTEECATRAPASDPSGHSCSVGPNRGCDPVSTPAPPHVPHFPGMGPDSLLEALG